MKRHETTFGRNRAFSAVIASLILMLLAVAAGVVVYAYVMGWIGGATQNPQRTGQMQFDSIYATSGSSGKIKMYVRNVGGIDLNLSKMYINGVETANNTSFGGYSLAVQTTAYLECNYTMTKSYFYEVDVICSDGTSLSQSVQAK